MTTTVVGLSAALETQNKRLNTQNKALTELATSQDKLRRFSRWLAGLYALTALSIVGAVIAGVVILSSLNATVERNKLSIREQCFEKGLLLSTYRPTGPSPTSAIPPEQYQALYRQLQDSADRLGCGIPRKVP
jgi:hypothetical protein